jgi:iron(III) transport system permease protein
MGAAAAPRDAGLHRGLRIHRLPAVLRPLAIASARHFSWQRADYWFPEIRSLPGAAFVFTVVLYPYVYLLARTAFLARTASMIDAARAGLTPWQTGSASTCRWRGPPWPPARLLALMETLADYGAAAYFGLQTFTTAIYRAWYALGDRIAASQLAAVLLVVVMVVMALEVRMRGRARFVLAPQLRPAGAARKGCRAALGWLQSLLAACRWRSAS